MQHQHQNSDRPNPKWWLLHATNYVVVSVFVCSVGYHIRESATNGPRLQRGGSSLLPVLLIWSCCMAYFFGFFGISFVDKDEDLMIMLERDISADANSADSSPFLAQEAHATHQSFASATTRMFATYNPRTRTLPTGRPLCPIVEEQNELDRPFGADGSLGPGTSKGQGIKGSGPRPPMRESSIPYLTQDVSPLLAAMRSSVNRQPPAATAAFDLPSLHSADQTAEQPLQRAPLGPNHVDGQDIAVPSHTSPNAGRAVAPAQTADSQAALSLVELGLRLLRLSGGATTTSIKMPCTSSRNNPEVMAAACIVSPTIAASCEVARAAHRHTHVRNVTVVDRGVYIRVAGMADTSEQAECFAYSVGETVARQCLQGARVASVAVVRERQPSHRHLTAAEATLPGRVVRRCLGLSVAEACAAKSRLDLARTAYARSPSPALEPFVRLLSASHTIFQALATAVGVPADGYFLDDVYGGHAPRLSMEAVNDGRDVYVSLTLETVTNVPVDARCGEAASIEVDTSDDEVPQLVHSRHADGIQFERVAAVLLLAIGIALLAEPRRTAPGAKQSLALDGQGRLS